MNLILFSIFIILIFGDVSHVSAQANRPDIVPLPRGIYLRELPPNFSCLCMRRDRCYVSIFVSSEPCPPGELCCLNNLPNAPLIELPDVVPRDQGINVYDYDPNVIPQYRLVYFGELPTDRSCTCKLPFQCGSNVIINSMHCEEVGHKCCLDSFVEED